MKPRIALFQNHPECSRQCCDGMITALEPGYDISIFHKEDDFDHVLNNTDAVAFPGGIGDADTYYDFFRRRNVDRIVNFIARGGHYLGICMGAYWAGRNYFDLLENNVDAVQYIKRPGTDVRRPYSTVIPIRWDGVEHHMFFYDGCAFTGDAQHFTTVANYANGDPMAIIQGRLGLIGCHPESTPYFYKPKYIKDHWHHGLHHRMLLDFADRLMKT
jgi:glutamine amidotransferase-like uncharacterized protein